MTNIIKQISSAAGVANYYLFILVLITLPLPWRITQMAWMAWMLFWFLEFRFIPSVSNDLEHPGNYRLLNSQKQLSPLTFPLLVMLFLAWEFISMLWAPDTHHAWRTIERHLSFFILPLVALFGVNQRYQTATLMRTFLCASVVSFFLYIFTRFYASNHYVLYVDPTAPFKGLSLNAGNDYLHVIKHRLFYCTTMTAALCTIPWLWKHGRLPKVQRAAMLALSAAIILLSMYFTFSRASIITLAVLVPVAVFLATKGRQRIITVAVSITVVAALLVVAYVFHPRLKDSTHDVRKDIWATAIHHLDEIPFYGLGAGQQQDFMLQKYEEDNFAIGEIRQYYPHNQYISCYIELGVIGVALLLLCLVSLPLCFTGDTRRFAILLTLLYALNMFTDDLLERIDPLLTLYALSILLFALQQHTNRQTTITA